MEGELQGKVPTPSTPAGVIVGRQPAGCVLECLRGNMVLAHSRAPQDAHSAHCALAGYLPRAAPKTHFPARGFCLWLCGGGVVLFSVVKGACSYGAMYSCLLFGVWDLECYDMLLCYLSMS